MLSIVPNVIFSIVRSLIVVMTLNQCLMSSAPFFRRNNPPSFLITALHLNWQIGLQRILLLRYSLASTASEPVEVQSLTSTFSWKEFYTVSETDIRGIMKSPSASGILDPMPTWLIKKLLDSLLHIITSIMNMSLIEGIVPSSMESAVIKPLLKKENLDCSILKTIVLSVTSPSCLKFLSVWWLSS